MTTSADAASHLACTGSEALLGALGALDRLLNRALRLAPLVYGWEPGSTQFRGLYISEKDVRFLLERRPGDAVFEDPGPERLELATRFPALAALAERNRLTEFDAGVLMVALAPEVDLRYERVYGYLQDDVARRRPSVDLALNLLCGSPEEKLACRSRFAAEAPLLARRLIRLTPEPNQSHSLLLAHSISLDAQVARELTGGGEMDARLAGFAERVRPEASLASLPLPEGHAEGLRRLLFRSRREGQRLGLWFRGPAGPLKRRTAEALASEADRGLLAVSAARAASLGADPRDYLRVAAREAWLTNAILYCEAGENGDCQLCDSLGEALTEDPADFILAAAAAGPAADRLGMIEVPFPIPGFATRRECWLAAVGASGGAASDDELDRLAASFRMYPDEIDRAVTAARSMAAWRGSPRPTAADLCAAARAHCGRQLGTLARKIEPAHGWDDIVLPAATLQQLRAICGRVLHHQQVLGEWGFDARLSTGKGVTALFAGPSGVGKTMAAEIIARELELDLYKIDLSSVVSKYIGETEKNLERIFNAAENASAILFFDEADSLFGKRSEVRDSHDRYANLEISYLLQKMEMYEGVAILASNLRQNLDESFVRRLAFTVHFPFPDEAHRRRIWKTIWPREAPVDAGLDFDFLAAQFKLSGGNIKNVALAAAFAAAEENSTIGMRQVAIAIEREYQKMSKPLAREQFGPYAGEVDW